MKTTKILFKMITSILLTSCFSIYTSTPFPPYENDFVELVELVYGKGYLSQDGNHAINQLFNGIELNGKSMLDIGCGLGGIDILIAKAFNASIIGIDPQQKLIQQAQEYSKNTKLKGSVAFQTLEQSTALPFPSNTFDIIFSRETILHVPTSEKQAYFKEMLRVLKPNGKLIISDWCHQSCEYSKDLKKMIESDNIPFNMITVTQYLGMLKAAGFTNISIQDETRTYVTITQNDIDQIKKLKPIIEKRFGCDTYNYALESWRIQKQCFERKEILLTIFSAEKSH